MRDAPGALRPLFVYGTLCDGMLFRAVTGRPMSEFRPRRARLPGARALRIAGDCYPLLAKGPGSARGLLVSGLPARLWRRIRFFEEPEYVLKPVRVHVLNAQHSVQALAFWPNRDVQPSREPWSEARWRRRFHAKAVAAAALYMEHFGREPQGDLDAAWREIKLSLEFGPLND